MSHLLYGNRNITTNCIEMDDSFLVSLACSIKLHVID
jgi:hypothetical protein